MLFNSASQINRTIILPNIFLKIQYIILYGQILDQISIRPLLTNKIIIYIYKLF